MIQKIKEYIFGKSEILTQEMCKETWYFKEGTTYSQGFIIESILRYGWNKEFLPLFEKISYRDIKVVSYNSLLSQDRWTQSDRHRILRLELLFRKKLKEMNFLQRFINKLCFGGEKIFDVGLLKRKDPEFCSLYKKSKETIIYNNMFFKKKLIFKSKNKKIKIYYHQNTDTYSIKLNGRIQTADISQYHYNKITSKINLFDELEKEEYYIEHTPYDGGQSIYLKLLDKVYNLEQKSKVYIEGFEDRVLTKEMKSLYGFLSDLPSYYYLAGGTAIALHLGHRESIDFDLFTNGQQIVPSSFYDLIVKHNLTLEKTERDNSDFSLSILKTESTPVLTTEFKLNSVQVTFMDYTPTVNYTNQVYVPVQVKIGNFPISLPSLKTLGGMKLVAVRNRLKNKDLYDLYFILKYHTLDELVEEYTKMCPTDYSLLDVATGLQLYLEKQKFDTIEDIIWKTTPPTEKELKRFCQKTINELLDKINISTQKEKKGFFSKFFSCNN